MEHVPTLSDLGNGVMRGWEADGVAYGGYDLMLVVQVNPVANSGLAGQRRPVLLCQRSDFRQSQLMIG